jgi:AbrB family looped-hinge helix DNA binding protein
LEEPVATYVTSKGQVTIPKPVRDHLGIRPGAAVEFRMAEDGRVVLTRAGARPRKSRFARIRGAATVKMSTDAIMALTRGDG